MDQQGTSIRLLGGLSLKIPNEFTEEQRKRIFEIGYCQHASICDDYQPNSIRCRTSEKKNCQYYQKFEKGLDEFLGKVKNPNQDAPKKYNRWSPAEILKRKHR